MTDTSAEAAARVAKAVQAYSGAIPRDRAYEMILAQAERIAELERALRNTQADFTEQLGRAEGLLCKSVDDAHRIGELKAELARLRDVIHKVEAALADIAEGEPDPDDTAENIWCKDRAAEGLFIARAALQEKPE